MEAAHSPFHKELSGLALFVSLPQLVASPIIVGLKHLLYHDSVAFELKEVLDFLLISFPLTLSVAALVVIIQRGQFNLFSLLIAVVGAALLSNLLHNLISDIPSVGVKSSLTDTLSNPENSGGNYLAINWIGKIFGVYWKTFGPILFIQSCCIGFFAGDKFLNLSQKKKGIPK